MSHPARFSPDDPFLARLRQVCLAFPEAKEKVSHGHPSFYTRKQFAIFGGLVPGDHESDLWAQSVLFLPDADEHPALLADDRFFQPAYYGPSGWLGLDFRAAAPDWDEVRELVDMSYRNTALKTLIKRLDAG